MALDVTDLEQLSRQYSGRKFGEFVLYEYKRLDLETTLAAFNGTTAELPPEAKGIVEGWLDQTGTGSGTAAYWRRDAGQVFRTLCEQAKTELLEVGVRPSMADQFNMFQVFLLNMVYTLHREPQSKAFVQKAIGMGYLRRLIS